MDVEEFIRDQAGRGQLHSSGAFTVDPREAWKKLGTCAFEGSFLLAFAQAAWTVEAEELRIRLAHRRLRFEWTGGRLSVSELRELSDWLAGSRRPLSPAVSFLSTGLTRAVGQGTDGVEFRWSDGQEGCRLELSENEFRLEPEAGGTAGVAIDFRRLRRAPAKELRRRVAVEHQALSSRCRYYPLPLTVDGRRINQAVPVLPVTPFQGPETLLAESFELVRWVRRSAGRRTVFAMPRPGEVRVELLDGVKRVNRRTDWPEAFLYGRDQDSTDAAVRMSLSGGRARLVWVQSGVAMTTELLDLPVPLATEIVADVGDLKVDLSGLQVVKDEAYEAALGRLKAFAQEVSDLLKHELNELASPHYQSFRHPSIRGVGLLSASTWTAAGWLLAPPGLGWLAAPVSALFGFYLGVILGDGLLTGLDYTRCLVWRPGSKDSRRLRQWVESQLTW